MVYRTKTSLFDIQRSTFDIETVEFKPFSPTVVRCISRSIFHEVYFAEGLFHKVYFAEGVFREAYFTEHISRSVFRRRYISLISSWPKINP